MKFRKHNLQRFFTRGDMLGLVVTPASGKIRDSAFTAQRLKYPDTVP